MKESFIWVYGFRGIRVHNGILKQPWKQENRTTSTHLKALTGSRVGKLGLACVSKLSKPASSATHPPTRQHLQLPNQHLKLEKQYSIT